MAPLSRMQLRCPPHRHAPSPRVASPRARTALLYIARASQRHRSEFAVTPPLLVLARSKPYRRLPRSISTARARHGRDSVGARAPAARREAAADQPLRRIEGLSLRSALRSDPRVPALAAAALLVPLAAALLALSGLALLATLAGVALAAPLVLLFSPVLLPAALGAALAVAGLAAAGALAVSGLSALVWVVGYVQRALAQSDSGRVGGMVVQPLASGKRHGGQGAPAFVGHRVGDDAGDALGTTKARDVAST